MTGQPLTAKQFEALFPEIYAIAARYREAGALSSWSVIDIDGNEYGQVTDDDRARWRKWKERPPEIEPEVTAAPVAPVQGYRGKPRKK